MRSNVRLLGLSAAALLLVTIGGCRQAADKSAAKTADTTPAVTTQAGEVMGARREAQVNLDSARAAVLARDYASASVQLRSAADFIRGHADNAVEPAKQPLVDATATLTRLANTVEKGGLTMRQLDQAFARANLAEARYHCTRALDAWKATNAGGTASEILMIADHFERAAQESGVKLSAADQNVVANARTMAAKLGQGTQLSGNDVEGALTTLDKQVHALEMKVVRPKG
jgi:hypothetical protein